MKKKILLLTGILLLAFFYPKQILASKQIKLWVDGYFIETDTNPIIENDRTLVPVRVISETLGYKVEWEEKSSSEKLITIHKFNSLQNKTESQMNLQIGIKSAITAIDGIKNIINLDVEPKIINDRTMVPIRVIAEFFGKKVDWDSDNNVVVIGDGYIAAPKSAETTSEFLKKDDIRKQSKKQTADYFIVLHNKLLGSEFGPDKLSIWYNELYEQIYIEFIGSFAQVHAYTYQNAGTDPQLLRAWLNVLKTYADVSKSLYETTGESITINMQNPYISTQYVVATFKDGKVISDIFSKYYE